jgi:hypothetical protein
MRLLIESIASNTAPTKKAVGGRPRGATLLEDGDGDFGSGDDDDDDDGKDPSVAVVGDASTDGKVLLRMCCCR